MRNLIAAIVVVLSACTFSLSQQASAPATKQDIEEMIKLTGSRAQIEHMWGVIGQQMAIAAANGYHRKHPQATTAQLQKVAYAVQQSFLSSVNVLSVEELVQATVPVYQRHLTHGDAEGIIAFYKSPAGQKFLQVLPQIQKESMEAIQPLVEKKLPEMEAAAEKAADGAQQKHPANRAGSTASSPK